MTVIYILPFTFGWYIVVGGFFAIMALFIKVGRRVSTLWQNRILSFLGIYLMLDLIFVLFYLWINDDYSPQTSLPLSFCSIMAITASIAAIKKSQFFYEFTLFFFIGPVQAFLTPALVYSGEEFLLWDYFIAHGITIIIPIYMTAVSGFAPRKFAALKSIGVMQLVVFAIFAINLYLKSNYMYLLEKPPVLHPFNNGPWPYYLLMWHAMFYSVPLMIQGIFALLGYLDRKTTGKIEY